ncbi:hypothetical protein HPB49_005035 [Dermacentor silvarum]|uniref:Uncharacterized protein n=1 Tax=Dermacentor silvarum TaxID=543639 RepID=A0ACB8D319_DERSI|nr:hypothetical protein HPB49_005035 [Dermacentor silvarum]
MADVIRRITCIELRGKRHPFNVHVADPEDSYKGVVHGFPAHTESADLEQHLRVRTQGMGVEMRCTEYRPTIQMCLECMQEGHRSDVCPNPKNICRGCGLENPPPQGHECEVRSVQGGGARDASVPEHTDCRQAREVYSPVSIASTEEEDLYRRRSRSPHRSRAMSNTLSRDPSSSRASQRSNSPLPKKQQEVGAKPAKLQGYYTLSDPQNSKVTTLGSYSSAPQRPWACGQSIKSANRRARVTASAETRRPTVPLQLTSERHNGFHSTKIWEAITT